MSTPSLRYEPYVGAATSLTTAITFVMAILTVPKSGPFCEQDCVSYPYADVATLVPHDFLWMYPALLPAPLLVIMLNLHHQRTAANRALSSRIAIGFAVMAATLLTADYFIQLRVIQPAILRGELDGVAPLTQFNPHGVFIALEEAGYVLMAVAFLFAGLAITAANRRLLAIKWIFIGGFLAVILLFVALSAAYGPEVEYRFEVAVIGVDWTVIVSSSALLAIEWRKG